MTDKKAVLSNRIYFKPDSREHAKQVMDALTYKVEKKGGTKGKFKSVEIIKNYKFLPGEIMSIPQGRTDLLSADTNIVDKRVVNEVPFPDPKFPLLEAQKLVFDEVDDTCFINALVGWGKTFTALHIAHKLKQKTLVITHTTALRDQWIDEVKKLYGMEPGVIGSGEFDVEDHFIVVGNIQSIIKFLPQVNKEFGTVILDEAHHVPAETFANLIDNMYCRYRIALSGTMLRTDGKHVIFQDYFGSKVFKPPKNNTVNPVIKTLNTGISLNSNMSWAEKINNLLYDEDYQNFIVGLAKIQMSHNHSVLVIADRVEFLSKVAQKLGSDCVLITGDTSFEERKVLLKQVETGEKMCIAGSRQIFSEGISVNRLSCVILAVPTSNPISLEQIIGRIMRQHPDKPEPEVLDICFSSNIEKRQAALRMGFYLDKGWKVVKA
jgi:superfamily II DNA or RNA helicase